MNDPVSLAIGIKRPNGLAKADTKAITAWVQQHKKLGVRKSPYYEGGQYVYAVLNFPDSASAVLFGLSDLATHKLEIEDPSLFEFELTQLGRDLRWMDHWEVMGWDEDPDYADFLAHYRPGW